VTIRNNTFNGKSYFSSIDGDQEASDHYIYNNSCYDTSATADACIQVDDGPGNIIRNNMIFCPNDADCLAVTDSTGATISNNKDTDAFSGNPYTGTTFSVNTEFQLDNVDNEGKVAQDAGFSLPGVNELDAGLRGRPVNSSWDVGAWEYGGVVASPPGGPATTPDNQIIGGSLGFNEPTTRESGAPLDNLDECTAVLTPTGGSSSLVTFPASSPNGGGVFDIDLSPYAGQTVEYYGSCTNADGEGPQSPKGSVEVALGGGGPTIGSASGAEY
jgi:hypothetical protein